MPGFFYVDVLPDLLGRQPLGCQPLGRQPLDIATPINTSTIPINWTIFGKLPNARFTTNVNTGTRLKAIADLSGPKNCTPRSQKI